MSQPATIERGEQGVALVVVLWILVIVTFMTLGFAASSRTETTIAANLMDGVRARALLRAGVERAVAGLRVAEGQLRWRSDGTAYPFTLDGNRLTIVIHDEAGRVDLNAAPPELLLRLMAQIGFDRDVAAQIQQLILARRQPMEGTTPVPANDIGRAAAHPETLPPFQSALELRALPLPQDVAVERLLPYVTVFAPDGKIDAMAAAAPVLISLGVTPGQANAILELRRQRTPVDPNRVMSLLANAQDSLKSEPGPVYRLRVEVTTARGSMAALEALVWVPKTANGPPYRVLAWEENWPDQPPSGTVVRQ